MAIASFPGLDALVERRIAEAIARGDFDDLPGVGKPLALDDDALVPEDVRVAYRILKNAGYVPPELEQIAEVDRLLAAIERAELGDAERARASRRLRALLIQIEASGRPATAMRAWLDYNEAITRRLR
ncbi:MAG: DnaJ family domain-containing protein [Burkholderiaceae bacterium]